MASLLMRLASLAWSVRALSGSDAEARPTTRALSSVEREFWRAEAGRTFKPRLAADTNLARMPLVGVDRTNVPLGLETSGLETSGLETSGLETSG